jgi:4-hydroxythreonine-4-phosphate dehydrogenase
MGGRIGISIGDPTGVGPEVTLKALAAESGFRNRRFTLLGDLAHLKALNDSLGLDLPLRGSADSNDWLLVSDVPETHLPPNMDSGNATAARAAVAWVKEGARLCLDGELAALVTAPVSKHAIVQAGISFTGHTELLSDMAGEPHTVMMLLGTDERGRWLRVALATVHMALRQVPDRLTPEKILLAMQRAAQACKDLGLARARVGVCGLNPHAGEGGDFGDEETRIIEPAIRQACDQGLDAVGPLSGDTVFHQAIHGEYDAVVAMYHDQGLAPLKLAAFNTGVNWTLGLPFVRTSPDHGTAYNIAGQGIADPSSMISAIRLAVKLADTAGS